MHVFLFSLLFTMICCLRLRCLGQSAETCFECQLGSSLESHTPTVGIFILARTVLHGRGIVSAIGCHHMSDNKTMCHYFSASYPTLRYIYTHPSFLAFLIVIPIRVKDLPSPRGLGDAIVVVRFSFFATIMSHSAVGGHL